VLLLKLTEGNEYHLNEVVELHTDSVLERQLPHVLQHKVDRYDTIIVYIKYT